MKFLVRLKDGVTEEVAGADAYVAEGPLTTFFLGRDGLKVLDSWAQRLASFRTADIMVIRWFPTGSEDDLPEPAQPRRYDRLLSLIEEDLGPLPSHPERWLRARDHLELPLLDSSWRRSASAANASWAAGSMGCPGPSVSQILAASRPRGKASVLGPSPDEGFKLHAGEGHGGQCLPVVVVIWR